jgi:hypothetical protein
VALLYLTKQFLVLVCWVYLNVGGPTFQLNCVVISKGFQDTPWIILQYGILIILRTSVYRLLILFTFSKFILANCFKHVGFSGLLLITWDSMCTTVTHHLHSSMMFGTLDGLNFVFNGIDS